MGNGVNDSYILQILPGDHTTDGEAGSAEAEAEVEEEGLRQARMHLQPTSNFKRGAIFDALAITFRRLIIFLN